MHLGTLRQLQVSWFTVVTWTTALLEACRWAVPVLVLQHSKFLIVKVTSKNYGNGALERLFHNRNKGFPAFTLIELLLALSASSFLLLLLFSYINVASLQLNKAGKTINNPTPLHTLLTEQRTPLERQIFGPQRFVYDATPNQRVDYEWEILTR